MRMSSAPRAFLTPPLRAAPHDREAPAAAPRAPAPADAEAGGPVLLLASSQRAPAGLGAAGCRGGLLMTTEHPSKARQRFGPAYEVLWATAAGESAGPTGRPAAP